ncbi:MAG: GntR family transcriptional regulator [Verrucomicrobia bacterium]|nr:GntR family transcriptional regulator [Verrucomicrobiota bacterium]
MQLQIDSKKGIPIYLQIVNQVKYLVASRRLEPGQEVLPIRALAEQLVVNPNTVARAYLELERAGILMKRHGTGTYVADAPPPVRGSQRLKILSDRADALLIEARQLGVELEETVNLVRARHAKMLAVAK